MIAAQHQGEMPGLQRSGHHSRDAPSHGDDAVDVLQARIGNLAHLLNGHFDTTSIFEDISETFQVLMEVRIPDRAGTHIHPAAVRTQIDGNTDNIDLHEFLLNVVIAHSGASRSTPEGRSPRMSRSDHS
jgi:hypothetical protein